MKKHGIHWITVTALALVLSGCGTLGGRTGGAPVIERGEAVEPPETTTKQPVKPGKAKPAESSGKGGYYLDDGPGDNPPENIDAIPDAVVKNEPLRAANSRPCTALGETYTPMTEWQPYQAEGIASWYGRRYHGQKTASGELYDMYGMTAAHTILPIPSYVRVTNPENGRSVVVKVNDRGPFKKDRLIDLSYAAAYKLRLVGKGSGKVVVEWLDPSKPQEVTSAPANTRVAANGSYVQLGAFRQKENADALRQQLEQQGLTQGAPVESWYNADLYRVRLGPYTSRDEAERAAENIRQTIGVSAIITTQ